MIAILSPAKSMDFEPVQVPGATAPTFENEAYELVKILRQQSKKSLKKTLSVSDSLAELNYERYQNFKKNHSEKNAKPALFAYTGDVYKGIPVEEYTATRLAFASKHVRILSGLYGVLRPLDRIQPYRLEMGTKLANPAGGNLYQYWSEKVTGELSAALIKTRSSHLLNLASQEYFKVIEEEGLPVPVMNVAFKAKKNGSYRTIGLFAKQARGRMVDYMVRNKATAVEDLKEFKDDGYRFSMQLSSDSELVFTRG